MAANEVSITEYADIIRAVAGGAQAPQDPPLAVQILATGVAIQSAAFNTLTKMIRVAVSGVDARLVINTANPTADAALSERWLAGTTEYRGVTGGNKLSAIAAT